MRIIAGERKGTILFAPKGLGTRPTLSRVRESLFSILGARMVEARVLDLYAGAGSLGFEALSRGAAWCDFVENSRPALEALQRNAEKLRFNDRCAIHRTEALRWVRASPASPPYDLILLDPPYGRGDAAAALEEIGRHLPMNADALVAAQAGAREAMPERAGRLVLTRREKYGETGLGFYEVHTASE